MSNVSAVQRKLETRYASVCATPRARMRLLPSAVRRPRTMPRSVRLVTRSGGAARQPLQPHVGALDGGEENPAAVGGPVEDAVAGGSRNRAEVARRPAAVDRYERRGQWTAGRGDVDAGEQRPSGETAGRSRPWATTAGSPPSSGMRTVAISAAPARRRPPTAAVGRDRQPAWTRQVREQARIAAVRRSCARRHSGHPGSRRTRWSAVGRRRGPLVRALAGHTVPGCCRWRRGPPVADCRAHRC